MTNQSINPNLLYANHRSRPIDLKKKLLGLQKKMYNYGVILTSDREEANDLMQETNFKVLKNIDKYHNNTNFKGWVFTIMHNTFINAYHKSKQESRQTDLFENLYLLELPQNSGLETPDEWLAFQEIMLVINRFSDSQKIPFLMYIDGYKYWEIADILCLPLGTIKSRIFLIRKQLKKLLQDYL